MKITKAIIATTMFTETGCLVRGDALNDEEYKDITGLIELRRMGILSREKFKSEFLRHTNTILIKHGIIGEPIQNVDSSKHEFHVSVN